MNKKLFSLLATLFMLSMLSNVAYAETDFNLTSGSEGSMKKYYANNTPFISDLSVDHEIYEYEVRNTSNLNSRELVNVLYRGNGGADVHARVLHMFDRNYLRYHGFTCYYGNSNSCQPDYIQPTNVVISPGNQYDVVEHWFGAFNSSESIRYNDYGGGMHYEYLKPRSSYNWNEFPGKTHTKVIAGGNEERSLRSIFWSRGTVTLNP
ncbi:hypothetical protein [Brevibacillus brevis]|nr:hypothetical protein [Brevibacillus brevis]MBY0087848.1 hypothetical protein [Brevibacillus brevis]